MKKQILLLLVYVLCSGGGLTLLKIGINKGFDIRFKQGMFHVGLNYILLLGGLLYVISFLLSLFAMSRMRLTYFYPISAGLIYVFVCVFGVVLLKEVMSMREILGMALIMAGVIIMNWPKGVG